MSHSSPPGIPDVRLRLLVEQLPAISWTTDADLRVTSVIGAGIDRLNLDSRKGIGWRLDQLHPRHGDLHRRIAAHRRAIAGESTSYDDHFAGRDYRSRVEPLRDDHGRIIGCIGVAHDITDAKRAEQELRRLNHELEERISHRTMELLRSNHRLREQIADRQVAERQLRLVESAVNHVTDSVVITDADLESPGPRIIYVNPAFERMTGYDAREVIGQSPRLLQGPRTDRTVLDSLRRALAEGRTFEGETINYRKSGEEFILEWRIAPIRGPGGRILNWVAIQRDITQQRRAEQATEQHQAELAHVSRLSTMGELASGLAHELNQPLAAIANYAQGCLRRIDAGRGDPTALRDAIDRIAAQASRAGRIIQRLRHFVRKRQPRRAPADVNHLAREAAGLMDGEARGRGIRVEFHLSPHLPRAWADAIQVEQVVVNLLRNAIEALAAHPTPHPRIQVRTAASPGGGEVLIEVHDNGPGIAPDQLDHVFSPFYTTKPDGMGIGLTISSTIAESHGGELWATPHDGGGVTFHLALPTVATRP